MPLSSAQDLRKFVTPEFVFGRKARRLAGRYARNLGALKAMVVSDPGVNAAGWTGEILDGLETLGIPHSLYLDVSPNPRSEEVMQGARVYAQEACNLLLAVGGGSPIDCAKGIGIVSANGGDILDYAGVEAIAAPSPPLICVPTTGGTSADISQFCIITDLRHHNKITIVSVSKTMVPDVSLIDPETLTTMPSELAAHTGFDALSHAIEAYVSNASSPITDLFALEAIRLISAFLMRSIAEPANLEWRRQVMLGSLNAGLAFSNAGLGISHAMAHALGGWLDRPHGLCMALVLPVGVRFNFETVPERYTAIAAAMGLTVRPADRPGVLSALTEELERLRSSLGISRTLRQVGVLREDLPTLARNAYHDACLATTPRVPTLAEIEELYERAF
jgi:alcohol dehydrogenase class IV